MARNEGENSLRPWSLRPGFVEPLKAPCHLCGIPGCERLFPQRHAWIRAGEAEADPEYAAAAEFPKLSQKLFFPRVTGPTRLRVTDRGCLDRLYAGDRDDAQSGADLTAGLHPGGGPAPEGQADAAVADTFEDGGFEQHLTSRSGVNTKCISLLEKYAISLKSFHYSDRVNMAKLAFKRVLLKVSGEVLMGSQPFGIDLATVERVAGEVAETLKTGVQLSLVIGGGNIFRGMAQAAKGMDRVSADHMGILATVMNALAMQGALQGKGIDARVLSAIAMPTVCETYSRAKAVHHLEAGRVVICAAGTGLPFFTTDTGAALRAAEMGCDALFKGTSVDGVYSADPKKDASAERFDRITFNEILARDLRIMDPAAIALARDNGIPVVVFSIRAPGAVLQVLNGSGKFTIVTRD